MKIGLYEAGKEYNVIQAIKSLNILGISSPTLKNVKWTDTIYIIEAKTMSMIHYRLNS